MEGGLMEFFLDTADVDEIREIAAWGILDGVTTKSIAHQKEWTRFQRSCTRNCWNLLRTNFC